MDLHTRVCHFALDGVEHDIQERSNEKRRLCWDDTEDEFVHKDGHQGTLAVVDVCKLTSVGPLLRSAEATCSSCHRVSQLQ